jgi:hypothetical protein
MTVKSEIVEMMDYLGMDTFPQDGYKSYSGHFQYNGGLLDGYDGYRVCISYDKNEDTLDLHCYSYGSGRTPRHPRKLCRVYKESEQTEHDPEPITLDINSPNSSAIMDGIHACLIVAVRDKANKKAMNEELSDLSWCQQ